MVVPELMRWFWVIGVAPALALAGDRLDGGIRERRERNRQRQQPEYERSLQQMKHSYIPLGRPGRSPSSGLHQILGQTPRVRKATQAVFRSPAPVSAAMADFEVIVIHAGMPKRTIRR